MNKGEGEPQSEEGWVGGGGKKKGVGLPLKGEEGRRERVEIREG